MEQATDAPGLVRLWGTDIATSRLGFGTSSLMGRLGKRESLRLLARAYDEGIRYFDTAPLYGYGEAEAVVGTFARGRSDVTLATKFGLSRPAARASLYKAAKNVARPLLARVPALRARARRTADAAFAPSARFDIPSVRLSLQNSLRALRRDRVDIFLLHDCRLADLRDETLLAFLEEARVRGEVRHFGIATGAATVVAALDEAPGYTRIVQLPNNTREPILASTPQLTRDRACITHSPFGGWGRTVPASPAGLLRYALDANSHGVVLFGTQKEERIAQNVRLLESVRGAS